MTPLSPAESAALAEEFRKFVADQLGLNFPPERAADLLRGVGSACPDLGFTGPEVCMRSLMSQPLSREKAEVLASHLTVGETYFFRESEHSFDLLEREILPGLIQLRRQGHRSLRLWSAGCATGEEPYSLAMLIDFKFPELRDWHVSILGTDINPLFLHKAATGIYGEWSFRQTPDWVKDTYFHKVASGKFELDPAIRRRVTFGYLNLAEDAYPAVLNNTNAIDVLLCRNVLMYFTPAVATRVVRRFELALVEGGWLSVSPCDLSYLRGCELLVPSPTDIALQQKQAQRSQPRRRYQPEIAAPVSRDQEPAAKPARAGNRTRPGSKPAGKVLPPRNGEPLREAGDLAAQGRYSEAAAVLAPHLQAMPQDSQAVELMAKTCANLGLLDEALSWCRRGLERAKLNTNLHWLEGTILAEEGKTGEALAALRRVLYLDPQHLLAHFALGNIYHQLGQPMDSTRHFQQALKILNGRPRDQLLAGAEGITAGRLREIITSTMRAEQP